MNQQIFSQNTIVKTFWCKIVYNSHFRWLGDITYRVIEPYLWRMYACTLLLLLKPIFITITIGKMAMQLSKSNTSFQYQ